MARTPNWKKNKVTSKVDISSVKSNELSSYVQAIANHKISLAIPQDYISMFSQGNAHLVKELKELSSLISSQKFTFRDSSKAKLYNQISKKFETILAIMTSILDTYKKMYNEYIGSKMVITNFKEINGSFAFIITLYNELLKLIEKIKDSAVKETLKEKSKDFKMGAVAGNGIIASKYWNEITAKIVEPTIECAKFIAVYEKEIKTTTQDFQYSLKTDVDTLKDAKSKSKEYIPEILDLCQAGIDKTLAEIKKEWDIAEKGGKQRQLGKLKEVKEQLDKIQMNIRLARSKFKTASDMADEALKKVKYGEVNVDVIMDLKRTLKNMVNSTRGVFAVIENPQTTETQRMDKINAVIQEINKGKKSIDSKVGKIKWDEKDPKTTEIIALINKSTEKFEKLNNREGIWKIRETLLQWNKAKPSAFIAFIQKYGKLILMALGFLVTIL